MAVYSRKIGGDQGRALEVTQRFRVLETVTIIRRNGNNLSGQIAYIGKDELCITGPYMPIETIKFSEIMNVVRWNAPADWK